MKNKGRKLIKKVFALMLALIMAVPTVDYSMLLTVEAAGTDITVKAHGGYEEGAYVEWEPVTGADGYQVYVSQDQSDWTQIDNELIRSYGTYFRADALGLAAGTWYVKIEAVTLTDGQIDDTAVDEKIEEVTVLSYDRSGYAWVEDEDGISTASGAYNDTGTLRSNANVIYVYNSNKDDVELEVNGKTYKGLQNILYAYNTDTLPPLDVRIIGNIDDFAVLDGGDILIDTNKKNIGITIEGVGEDAVANGWGIRLQKAVNVEIRNLGFINCDSDEGDNIGLQQDNTHIWVHNCDLFYGKAGSDADQKKGDGMLDCKWSDLITFSYNHFWDSGKSCLLGLSEGYGKGGRITYHHNWFDHSDSRHPRVRYFDAHVYNNYYDGNAKYGIGATQGASVFAESNYFRNTKNPMLISQQGTDVAGGSGGTFGPASATDGDEVKENEDGGMIKAYGNILVGRSESTFIPYAEPISSTQEDLSQSENNEFVAYVAIDDADEESDLNKELNNDESVDEDVEGDDDTTNADKENASDDNINDDTDNMSGDNSADADMDMGEVSGDNNADANMDEVSDDDNKSVESGFEAEVSDAQDSDITGGSSVEFDAYVVEDKTTPVPNTVKSKKGGNTYSNFDTEAGFYIYTPDNAADVPDNVMAKAGRVNGGDLQFEFNGANDDTSSDINTALQALCVNYESALVSVGGVNSVSTTVYYTVTFDPGNGEQSWTEKVEINTKVTEPETPATVPEGKKFDGWYNGARKWNFDTLITGNVTLTGKWIDENESSSGSDKRLPINELTKHDVTVDGTDSAYFDIEATTATSTSTSGTYNGVSYSSGSGKIRLDLRKPATIEFTTTIAARVVLFMDNKNPLTASTYIDGKAYAKVDGIIESDVIAPGDHKITRKDNDFMYAIWVEPAEDSSSHTVIIDLGNGLPLITKTLNFGEMITESDIPELVRDGYTFKGWVDDEGNSVTLPYVPTSDVTITAKWANSNDMELTASEIAAETYASSFDKNGFTITASSSNKVTVESNSKTIDGKSYTARLKTGGAGTANYRSIKFTTQGAATLYMACMAASSSNTSKMGVATVNGSTLTDYTDYYYLIDGYDKEDENKYKKCSDGSISVDGSSGHYIIIEFPDKAEYCIYSKENGINFYYVSVTHKAYTVTFNTNGGSSVGVQTVNSGDTCNEPADVPIKDGYTFDGWYSDEGLTQLYDFTSPVTENITLFAKWIENPTIYTVTFVTNGGSEVPAQTVESGLLCIKPDDPTKDNCTFVGWYKDEELKEEYDFNAPVTVGITLYAKWKDNNTEKPGTEKQEGFNIKFKNDQKQYTYTGSAITPEITVTYNDEKLVKDIDYTVKYSNNIKAASKELKTDAKKLPKVTVTGKGRFSGNDYENFEILQKSLDADDVTVSGVVKEDKADDTDNASDTDNAAELNTITVVQGAKVDPVIYYNNIKLTTKDYTVTGASGKKYTSADNTKTLTITAKPNSNYKGTLALKLNVIEKGEKFKVSFKKEAVNNLIYDGQVHEIAPVLDPSSMVKGTDYTLQYSDAVNAGTVKCTVIGMGKYTGCSVTKTYKIKPAAKKNNTAFTVAALPNNGVYTFDSAGVTLDDDLKVYDKEIKIDEDNNKLLELGKDYKVTYSNNKKVSTDSKKASYKITFLGNYKGSSPISNSFTINKALLCNNSVDEANNTKKLDIVIPNKVSNGKDGVYKSVPYVSIDGITLKKSDYTVAYYTDSDLKTPMDAQHKVSAGATVYVKITGKGNYDSTASDYIKAEYTVQDKPTNTIVDLSKASVTLNAKKVEYTGDAQIDNVKEISIKVNGAKKTIPAKDFADNGITVQYVNNKAKGKATIVISGDGTKYVGSKTTTFSITARKFKLASAAN
ncbi:MAG: hypothetical protein HDR03_06670 [Lachnospiraceae bacterium]|nr:hypothetical protein [Lachnospiraceae bacterium]